jgi:hypothetical protein
VIDAAGETSSNLQISLPYSTALERTTGESPTAAAEAGQPQSRFTRPVAEDDRRAAVPNEGVPARPKRRLRN